MPKIFSLNGFDAAHIKRTEDYTRAIDGIYNEAVKEYAAMADRLKIDPKKPFSFKDYPVAKRKADEITASLASKMQGVISEGTKEQWLYACKKNDEFVASLMNTTKIPKKTLEAWQDRNLTALSAFQTRKINGLGLSDRIWNYSGQMKTQMELGIDIAIGDDKSAQQLSKDLKQYLVDPDKLFRRVRDKHGSLVLSKAAKAFNPGQGKYRSSHKNALRLTRTEINMAYRESDRLRWSNLDFVIGFEVKLSNNHTINGVPFVDICDHLKGKYPKAFVFKGWHPQCRCSSIPILMDPDEFDTDELNELKAAINDTEYKPLASKNAITDVPKGFKDWIADNAGRSKGWKSQPYWIKDNFKGGNITGGLSLDVKEMVQQQAAKVAKAAPIVNAPKVAAAAQSKIPQQLADGGEYVKGTDIKFNEEFFGLIDESKPIKLTVVNKGKGSCYNPLSREVYIVNDSRNVMSLYHKESVIYHEYGHAIDWQRGLRNSPEVSDLMKKHAKLLSEKVLYTRTVRNYDYAKGVYVNTRETVQMRKIGVICDRVENITRKAARMRPETFAKYGITRSDLIEQLTGLADTMKAINNNYGYGHPTAYFKRQGMKEAEFIAHCFENKFVGNVAFKKLAPELYDDMIKYVDSLK